MNRRKPVAAALLGIFAAPVALAQQAAAPIAADTPPPPLSSPAQSQPAAAGKPVTTLREIVVTGEYDKDNFSTPKSSISRLPPDPRDIPQSVTVINKALMQSQGAATLADALRNVPGLTIGAAEGGQIGNNINLNGFSARTDVFLDGGRDRGQYFRDTFALDAVEVLMGPSSMLFGRGSTGGVVNQVTKKPTLTAANEVSGALTTNGLARATADFNRPLSETSAFRVALMTQSGDATSRDQSRVRDSGIAPSFKTGIGTPTEITLSALLLHNRDMPDYGLPPLNGAPANVSRDAAYGFTDDRTLQDVTALTAIVEHRIDAKSSFRNQTQYNRVHTDAVETAPNTIGTVTVAGFVPLTPAATSSLPLAQLYVRQQSHDRDIHDTAFSNQSEWTARFGEAGVQHTLLAGLEFGRDTYNNQNYARNGSCNGVAMQAAGATTGYVDCEPLLAPVTTTSPTSVPRSTTNLATGSANSQAAYLNDTLAVGKEVKLVGGLRYDRYAASIANSINLLNTRGSTTLASADQTVTYTSVRLGAIWQPTTTQSHYLSYSTSFNPSLEQLVSTTGISTPLPPEKNKAYELGSKLDSSDGDLAFNAAVFEITKFNARSQNSDGTFVASGTIRVDGARIGASGRITKDLQIFTGYTWLDARITDAIAVGTQGKVPGNTPKGSANLWTTYAFIPHWEVAGGMSYVSSRYANNTNTVQVPNYVRWDASLAYRQRNFDVRLNVFNLGNKRYFDQLIQSDGGRSVPGGRRSAMLSATYRF